MKRTKILLAGMLAVVLCGCAGTGGRAETESGTVKETQSVSEMTESTAGEPESAAESLTEEPETAGSEWAPSAQDHGSQYAALEHPQLLLEYEDGDDGALLTESEAGFAVRVRRVYTDGEDAVYADLALENHSQRELAFDSMGVAVNHTMVEPNLSRSVAAGKTEEVTLFIPDLSASGITEVGSLEFAFAVADAADYTPVENTEELTVTVKEEAAAYQVTQEKSLGVIYEDENLRLTAYEQVSGEYGLSLPVCAENLSGKKISLSCDTALCGGVEFSAPLYGEMFADACLYTQLTIDAADLAGYEMTEFSDLHFTLTAFDPVTFDELFQTEDIAVYEENGGEEME